MTRQRATTSRLCWMASSAGPISTKSFGSERLHTQTQSRAVVTLGESMMYFSTTLGRQTQRDGTSYTTPIANSTLRVTIGMWTNLVVATDGTTSQGRVEQRREILFMKCL